MFSKWLAPVRDKIPADLPIEEVEALSQAINEEAMRRFSAFLSGVRNYQSFPARRAATGDVATVWQAGTTRLLDYAPASKGPVLLVVPSLVNRFEILDIDPDHSFLRFMASQGFRPIVIDWHEPGEEEKAFSLSDYATQRLLPILSFVTGEMTSAPCHLLGYCMGGLMALSMAVLQPDKITSLTLMATPWDFAAKGVGGVPPAATYLGKLFLQQARGLENYLDQVGYLPPQFLQAVFTGFQSLQVLQKFLRFGAATGNETDIRRFVLTEDWLNNGIALALPVAKECLNGWYAQNTTAELQWKVADHLIDPRSVEKPTYVIAPSKDKIVPPECATPLADLIKGAVLHAPDIGHIGLMTGDQAPEKVWKSYAAWLQNQH